MDPREYLDARWYALVREAEELGASDAEAPEVVQRVLADNQRAIRRADDPDPEVRAALAAAITGAAPPRRPRWLAMAVAATVLVGIGAAIFLARPDEPPTDRLEDDQVPSLFGYDGATARDFLEGRGFEVTLEQFRSCEVMDRVVASDPAVGSPYDDGEPITVYTSLPADVTCLTDYQDRVTAWQLLDFANGRGAAPPFADRVFVYAGDSPATVLTGTEAADAGTWRETGVLDALRRASGQVVLVDEHPVTYAIPAIRVIAATEALGICGVPEPTVAGTGDAFSLLIRPPDRSGCGVRVDLYRSDGRIDGVVLYLSS